MIDYLGINIRENEDGLKLTVMNSATGKLEKVWEETDRFKQLEEYRQEIEGNISKRMKLLRNLATNEFNAELTDFFNNHRFKEYKNLQKLAGVSGYYMLILDEYHQVYIGSSSDILQKIRNHWTKNIYLSRPFYDGDHIRIDVFKALDTKRVFAFKSNSLTAKRVNTLAKEISDKFIINTTLKY